MGQGHIFFCLKYVINMFLIQLVLTKVLLFLFFLISI